MACPPPAVCDARGVEGCRRLRSPLRVHACVVPHLTPLQAMASLQLFKPRAAGPTGAGGEICGEAANEEADPTVSVVQLPCCGFVWHGTVAGKNNRNPPASGRERDPPRPPLPM